MSTEKKSTTDIKEAQSTADIKEARATEKTVKPLVYCGPTIKGIAPQYTVFTDGMPEKLKEKVEQVPLIKAMLVPLSKFAEMRVKIEQPGTRENILYKKVAELMK